MDRHDTMDVIENMDLKADAKNIIERAIAACLPGDAVKKYLDGRTFSSGRLIVIAVGKAAWLMASSAHDVLNDRIDEGLVITKYDHAKDPIQGFRIIEAGHPVSDANSCFATETAIHMVEGLKPEDNVLFLLSGGASALFEKPLNGIGYDEIGNLNRQLLKSGASIDEINIVRKHLSAVKGGRFAEMIYPAKVTSIIISDVLGDRPDSIGSGPTVPDMSTVEEAVDIVRKHEIVLTKAAWEALAIETPETLNHAVNYISGSVRDLVGAAKIAAIEAGYHVKILTDHLDMEAEKAGKLLATTGLEYMENVPDGCVLLPRCYIAGGETVVRVRGCGKGGRNQHLVLSAAIAIAGREHIAIASAGSDGTDGPTDAAGGICDGYSILKMEYGGHSAQEYLQNNDSYHALERCGGLIKTGPTGTNVNDLSLVMIG